MSGTGMAGFEGVAPVVTVGAGNPEALKYGEMWKLDAYRKVAPGEQLAQTFLAQARPRPGSTVIDFGCGTGRGALMMALLGGVKVTMVDFVNNCLDEDVRNMLVTQAHALRFVKADLETGPLPVGEYGFCTDTMEHIPPDKVDRVLDNILRAAQHVFFSISTVEDSCGVMIGQPLHLTIQPYAWWLEQFTKRQCVVHWSKDLGAACLFYVTAWATGKDITDAGILNIEDAKVLANVKHNIAQGWNQIAPHETNEREVMILGGGPSMPAFEDEIRRQRAAGMNLVTLNGAYNWALDRGLGPVTQIIVDARPFNARFVQPIRADCLYLISSQCDPGVFEGLPKDRTLIWHTLSSGQGPVWEALKAQYSVFFGVPGGSTVLLRAIPLLRMLGFKRFHLYGCDSCLDVSRWELHRPEGDYVRILNVANTHEPVTFASREAAQVVADVGGIIEGRTNVGWKPVAVTAHHAYAQPENDAALVLPVSLGGRIFACHPWMVSQCNEMLDLIRVLGDEIELEIHGDGMLAWALQHAADLEDARAVAMASTMETA